MTHCSCIESENGRGGSKCNGGDCFISTVLQDHLCECGRRLITECRAFIAYSLMNVAHSSCLTSEVPSEHSTYTNAAASAIVQVQETYFEHITTDSLILWLRYLATWQAYLQLNIGVAGLASSNGVQTSTSAETRRIKFNIGK